MVNRFNKVLLLNAQYEKVKYAPLIYAGLGYIAEALRQHHIEYDVIDMNLGYELKDVIKKIEDYKPDLIGLQILSLRYNYAYRIIKTLKERFPEIKIVAGGGHISLFREKVLKECPQIDYGVVLEGDQTIVDLCKAENIADVKGLLYHNKNNVVYTGDRGFITDLDNIPFPTYEKFELSKYPEFLIHVVSSRGCPYGCGFCPVEKSIGRRFRVRSAKNVVDELEYWSKQGINNFGFVDDNFSFYKERVIEICDEIEKRNLKLRMILGNGIRADKADYNLLKRMKEVGFYSICFGVESANNHVLKNMGKAESIECVEEAIKNAVELGYIVGLFYVIGYPGETLKDLENSFKLALKYPIGYANFYNLMPFPETPLYKYLSENNFLLQPYENYLNRSSPLENIPCFITPEMGYDDRVKAFKLAKKVSNTIIKKRIAKRYAYLGSFAKVAGHIFVMEFVQNSFLRNKYLKKIMNKFK
ncbi:MAG: radical SAM protein [Candidatus Woesearchaeota archaeon]